MMMQLIFICSVYIFIFTYLLNCMCSSQINTHCVFPGHSQVCRAMKLHVFDVHIHCSSTRGRSVSLFQLSYCHPISFLSLFSVMPFAKSSTVLKQPHECGNEVLSSVPK